MQNASSLFIYCRIVAASFVVILFGMGTFYTLPVFYPIFVRTFGWTRGQVGLAATVILGVAAFSSIVVGRLADWKGPRTSILIGILLTSLSMLSMSRMHSLGAFYTSCVLLGAGIASYNIMIAQMLMARWFTRRRGLATGIVIGGMGLGGTLGPLFVSPVIARWGFRDALLTDFGLLLFVALPIAFFFLRDRPAELGLKPFGADDAAAEMAAASSYSASTDFSTAIRGANFWCIALCAFCLMFDATSVLQHIVLYLREQSYSSHVASGTLSMLMFSSVLGRGVLGILSDVINRRAVLMLAFLLLSGGTTLLLFSMPHWGYVAMAITLGLGYGGGIVAMTLTAAEVFGIRHLGAILGVIMLVFNSGGASGPPLTGFLADRSGYRMAFTAALLAGILGIISSSLIRIRRAHPVAETLTVPLPTERSCR